MTLKHRELVLFFRSLSTFMQSGIPLLRSLECLAQQGESANLRQSCHQLAGELLKGNSLSAAIGRQQLCPEFAVQLLRCAERSGQLAAVLERLALHYVEQYRRRARLRAALTYPLIMLVVSLAMAVLIPTLVLKDLLRSFESQGALPWPTLVLVLIGKLASSPWFWLFLVAGVVLLVRAAPGWERWKRPVHTVLAYAPGSRNFYRCHLHIQFLTSLALQLRAGLPLLGSLREALDSSGSPLLDDSRAQVLTAVMDGMPLSQALLKEPLLGESLSRFLEAGEETGRLDAVLEWMSRMTADKLEYLQDGLMSLLEPFILLVMGIVAGVVTVGTLLPTFQILDQL